MFVCVSGKKALLFPINRATEQVNWKRKLWVIQVRFPGGPLRTKRHYSQCHVFHWPWHDWKAELVETTWLSRFCPRFPDVHLHRDLSKCCQLLRYTAVARYSQSYKIIERGGTKPSKTVFECPFLSLSYQSFARIFHQKSGGKGGGGGREGPGPSPKSTTAH